MSVVDSVDIPANEKMLRLQSTLSGKAHKLVKDLGFSQTAYERAKVKLEKKYGGERRMQIKHLTTLKNWPKVRAKHLEDISVCLGTYPDSTKGHLWSTRGFDRSKSESDC